MIGRWRLLTVLASLGLLAAACRAPVQDAPALPVWTPPQSPLLAVSTPAGPLRLGTPMVVVVDYRTLPPGSGVVVSLVRAAGPAAEGLYDGLTGPIASRPLTLSGDGRATMRWDGANAGYGGDLILPSYVISPGRYRFRAAVYPHSRFMVGHRGEPASVGESYSEPFLVTGPIDATRLARWLREPASEQVADLPWAEGYGPPSWGWWVDEGRDFRRDPRGWCMDFQPRPPMTGILTACAPLGAVSPEGLRVREMGVRFYGRIGWPGGVIQGPGARDAALAITPETAVGLSKGKASVAERRARLEAMSYRPDLKAWLVVLRVRDDPRVVRVSDAGRACTVAAPPGWVDWGRTLAVMDAPCAGRPSPAALRLSP